MYAYGRAYACMCAGLPQVHLLCGCAGGLKRKNKQHSVFYVPNFFIIILLLFKTFDLLTSSFFIYFLRVCLLWYACVYCACV